MPVDDEDNPPVTLRPVYERDTLPPPPVPTRAERDRALDAAIMEVNTQEQILIEQIDLARRLRSSMIAYRQQTAIVHAYDIEATP